ASFGSSPGTLPSAPVYCPGQEPAAAPPPPPPPPAPDRSVLGTTLRPALVLSQVSMSPRRFRVGHASTALSARTRPKRQAATGTLFRWRLSEPATVRIAIFRRIAGHLVGRRCRADQLTGRPARAKGNRCVFDRRLGTISRRAGGGAGRLAFSGRLGKTP